MTAFCAVLDPAAGRIDFSSAGHNPPRLVRGGKVRSVDAPGGLPLSIVGGQNYEQASVQLVPGDLLLLYTDGITEAMATVAGQSRRELFGTERLDALLLDCRSSTAGECVERIRTAVTAFGQTALPNDDQTLIAIRWSFDDVLQATPAWQCRRPD